MFSGEKFLPKHSADRYLSMHVHRRSESRPDRESWLKHARDLCFSHNLARILVFSQSQENWLAQFQITCPLGEFDLADEFWIDPGVLSHLARSDPLDPFAPLLGGQIGERTAVALFLQELLVKQRERLGVKARPNFAGKEQPASFVIPDEERAEIFPRARGRRISTDDEFLFIDAFKFDPGTATPARLIDGIAPFANNPFQTMPFDLSQQLSRIDA